MASAVHPPVTQSPFISYGRRNVTGNVTLGGICVA